MEDKKGDLQSNGVLKQNLLLQTSKKINRNLNKKITNQRGITLLALVVTIVILLILSGITISSVFGDNGIIEKSKIAKNEVEVGTVKEALKLYYLSNDIGQKEQDPVNGLMPKEEITDETLLNIIMENQAGIGNIKQIEYSRLYKLDLSVLGIPNIEENKYFMDIGTKIVYINNGIKLSKGITYVLEEKEIWPVYLRAEEIEEGFKLIANVEDNTNVRNYNFYIGEELYKIVSGNGTEAQINVTDKDFGEYECYVKVNRMGGTSDSSPSIVAENYCIKNANDMEVFKNMVKEGNTFAGKRVKVVADIDLGGSKQNRNWEPIGIEGTSFSGTLEGNNHKISNIYNKEVSGNYQGLFGVAQNATIQNIIIEGGQVQGREFVGGIIGNGKGTNIIDCENHAQIIAQKGNVGGIVGRIEESGKVEQCTNYGSVSSSGYINDVLDTFIGGIIGSSYNDIIITGCINQGNITSEYSATGGIIGAAFGDGNNSVNNCENKGTIQVTGKNINNDATLGGVLGYIINGQVDNCKNQGEVIGEGNKIGGVMGIADGINFVSYCTNINTVTQNNGFYIGGIIGLNSLESKVFYCTNSGQINANSFEEETGNTIAGGIIGNSQGTINECINNGNVIANGAYVGGIAGNTISSITNCHNEGIITVKQKNSAKRVCVGGISGQLDTEILKEDAKIENCYNMGNVYGIGIDVAGITAINIGGTIKNCYNTGSVTTETGVAGGIVSESFKTSDERLPVIENCYNTGAVEAKGIVEMEGYIDSIAGGIVAGNHGITRKCWNEGKVYGISVVGGIVGTSLKTVTECYNLGTIESKGKNTNGDSVVGGIIGNLNQNADLSYCYNKGIVSADYNMVGGIVGFQEANSTVSNSYNTFQVEQKQESSMLVGRTEGTATLNNCYYLGTTTSNESRTEADMKTQAFVDLLGGSTYWKLDRQNQNNGFIILNWQ